MKTPVLTLITAVLGIAIGIAVGFNICKGGGSHEATTSDQANSALRKSQSSRGSSDRKTGSASEGILADLLKGREISQLSAGDAFKLLESRLSKGWDGDPLEMARNYYEIQLLLSKLPTPVLEQVVDLSRRSGTPPFRIEQFFAAFAMRDWQKAMDWANRQPDSASWKSAAISRLASSDLGRAAELYQDGKMNGIYTWQTGYNIANTYAKQGLQPLLSFLDTLPSRDVSNLLSESVGNIPKADIPELFQEVSRRIAGGSLNSRTLNRLFYDIAQTSPEDARKWIDSREPGKNRSELEVSLATSLICQGKGDEALALLKSAMGGVSGDEKEFFTQQASNLILTNPAIVSQLADALPEDVKLTKEDWKAISVWGRDDTMVDVAKLIKSPDEQADYLKNVLENLSGGSKHNEADFQLLSHRLQSLSLTGTAASTVQEALANARQKALGK